MDSADIQRIRHIKQYCEDITEFVMRFGDGFEIFSADRAYFNAVSMCILQIGELSNGLSEEFRTATKDQMPWSQAKGMRNWIAHSYNTVEADIVWRTVKKDIPMLLDFCNHTIEKSASEM